MKVRALTKRLEEEGWVHVRTRGDHRIYKKEGHPRVIAIPGAPNDEMPIGTLKSIMREAGLK